MTNEEAREVLQEQIDKYGQEYDVEGIEALEMAIKALEQTELNPSYNSVKTELKSCEDCVSREALINELKLGYFNKDLQEGKNDPCVLDAMIDWAIRTVKRQPSVTPKAKIGHWIDVESLDGLLWHNCSECGETKFFATDFCPNCGTKMEVEE